MEPSHTSSTLTEGPWSRGGVAAEESIKLIPKIRPTTTPDLPDYVKYVCHKALTLSAPGAENAHWDFDFVASPHTRQSSFFRVAGRPMADHFLAFYNAAIIAYGQTGSGKTHTMLGTLPYTKPTNNLPSSCLEEMPREAGLIPRVLSYIFQKIAADSNGGPNHKQPAAATCPRQLPQPPPASLQTCTTPVAEHVRPRGRSGIPTPRGVPPRNIYLSATPASPAQNINGPKPADDRLRPGRSPQNKPASAASTEYLVKASMLQIYQEVVTDLLNPRPLRLQIRESMEGGVMVVGLSEVTVRSAAEALQLLRLGTSHRAVAETASNPVSSRSHCILTLHMEAKDKMDTGVVRIRRSRLQLVDLAGSERSPRGADYGSTHQKETNAINKSLSTLCLVISRLTDRNRSQGPVPYRDSKLTFLLQDCLGGNAKTLIVANLNPSPTCANETNITLGFALRAKRVRNRAVVNEDHQGDAVILQDEVRRLRQELSIFRTLHDKDGPPQGIEELSAWRDQAAARVSQLHQALQVNGELEEKLAAKEAEYSRLRLEHAALEEQCEAQRCEMSALEATVEQCEDELHELRFRPTLDQLKTKEEQLAEALRERDDARAQHADAAEQNLQLHDQCEQLSSLLQSYQQQSQLHDPAATVEAEPNQDYAALKQAYARLKALYASVVEQNRQLQLQLGTGKETRGTNDLDADQEESCHNESHRKQHHRYPPSDSCLISGGLEAVTEAAEEYCVDEFADGTSQKTRIGPGVASPSEQVRLASPAPQGGGSPGQKARAASLDGMTRPSSPPSSARASRRSKPQWSGTLIRIRKRCHSKGRDAKVAAAAAVRMSTADSAPLECSIQGSSLQGERSYDSAPPSFNLTNVRPLASMQACSPLQAEVTGMMRQDGDDAAESRSLGTLIRVNPLFDCRANGEDRSRSAGREDEVDAVEVTSTQPKSRGSVETPARSESLACELPLPPDEQISGTSPGPKGGCHSDGRSDSTTGVVRVAGLEGGAEVSVISDARGRPLCEVRIQSPSALTVAPAEPRRSKAAMLLAEPSFAVTPCSHPQLVEAGSQNVKPVNHSPRCSAPAGNCAGENPESPVSTFAGFAGGAVVPFESTQSASKVDNKLSRAPRSVPSISPLSNRENIRAPPTSNPGVQCTLGGSKGGPLVSPFFSRSPCVTGVSGASPLGSRLAWSASSNAGNNGRAANRSSSPIKGLPALLGCGALGRWPQGHSPGANKAGTPDKEVSRGGTDLSVGGSVVTEEGSGPSWVRDELLAEQENVAQLEMELALRLQGEAQLRSKLQQAQMKAQDAEIQAADLLALNNGMIEEIAERDKRLRGFEEIVASLESELQIILGQEQQEMCTPGQRTHAADSTSSMATCTSAVDADAPAAFTPEDSEPVTISPAERPRVIQSFETGVGSPLSFGAGSSPQYSLARLPANRSSLESPSQSGGSRNDVELGSSPLSRSSGSVQRGKPTSAIKTGLLMLFGKVRDRLVERERRVAGLEQELEEARSRLLHLEQELQKLEEARQMALSGPGAEGECAPIDTTADGCAGRPVDTLADGASNAICVDVHGFIAPPSPACSDSDPHPPAPWNANRGQPTTLESSMRREASLQAQLRSRDCQLFVLLERNEQLEESLRVALAERDQIKELQNHKAHLATNLQAQMWRQDVQVTELQTRVAELDMSLQRATAEAVRYRQQAADAVEQRDRYALELRGLERREELLMNKLRTLEMSCAHRLHEIEELRADRTVTAEQLSALRARAMAAEVEVAHERQTNASLEDQLEDLRRNMGLVQQPQLTHRQQPHYTVSTIRPISSSAGGTHPVAWPMGGHGPQLPYIYTARSDGSIVEGHARACQMPSLPHMDYGAMGHDMSGMSVGGRPLGRSSRNLTYSQAAPPAPPVKAGHGHGFSKAAGSRGHASAPSAAGMEHGTANKGTWVQRFLCRKGVSTEGSPGQEAHVAILTPAKWRTKGMTGIVLRQWVNNGSSKNAWRKGG